MKIYNLKEEPKVKDKINFLFPLIVFILLSILLFPFFYYVLSEQTELLRSIITSLVISLLIGIDIIISRILSYEKKTIVIDKNDINILMVQKETDFYGTDVKRKIDIDYKDKDTIKDVINNQDKYIGLSLFDVNSYNVLKKNDKYVIIVFDGTISKWKYKEENKVPKYVLFTKNKKIKMKIDEKYDNIKEMIDYFTK